MRGRKRPKITVVEPEASARFAGLRYVRDSDPGLRRKRAGRGFSYVDASGLRLTDRETLRRIRSLVIPPAWTDVWICPLPAGHLQASGRDARGRKQYRYHPRWRRVRDENKYNRLVALAEALPAIRRHVDEALSRPGLTREKVLGTVVRLLETTHIRVGNEEYARANKSFGLTTLRTRHVEVSGSKLRFRFRGKSGKSHEVDLHDRRIANIVKRCQDVPGYELFQYVDDTGASRSIDAADVNEYLREIAQDSFTAKDFRTWAGTVLAARELLASGAGETEAESKRRVVAAVKAVAERLGNTPAVCRAHYIHPGVISRYLEGSLHERMSAGGSSTDSTGGLSPEESALLSFLRRDVQTGSDASSPRARDETPPLASGSA
jgi:DNA topoisomerase-1